MNILDNEGKHPLMAMERTMLLGQKEMRYLIYVEKIYELDPSRGIEYYSYITNHIYARALNFQAESIRGKIKLLI